MLPSISVCKRCRSKILWMKTKAGKNMPVDWDARYVDDTEYSMAAGHISHWSTCPDADKFRKPNPPIYSADDEGPIIKKLNEIPGKHHDSPGLFDEEPK